MTTINRCLASAMRNSEAVLHNLSAAELGDQASVVLHCFGDPDMSETRRA